MITKVNELPIFDWPLRHRCFKAVQAGKITFKILRFWEIQPFSAATARFRTTLGLQNSSWTSKFRKKINENFLSEFCLQHLPKSVQAELDPIDPLTDSFWHAALSLSVLWKAIPSEEWHEETHLHSHRYLSLSTLFVNHKKGHFLVTEQPLFRLFWTLRKYFLRHTSAPQGLTRHSAF